MQNRIIEGQDARALGQDEKWELLSPFLVSHGREALSYATLQDGMEYFIHPQGYVAFTTVTHPVFARRGRRIALSDPVCAPEDLSAVVKAFTDFARETCFAVVSESAASVMRDMGFKANCVGYEPEIPIQTYNTLGNWKDLDLIKRARNEAKREGILIREERDIEKVSKSQLNEISARWISQKKVNDREIWIYARRPVLSFEQDVRKFVAYDKDGRVAGFIFYDPMYRGGRPYGYSANISRCDEQRYGRLATAINMVAAEQFRDEGREVINLCLAPFVKLDSGRYNDDSATKAFFQLSERYGNDIYNFKGLSFYKAKYRAAEKSLYFVSNNSMPANDVYLAFLSSDITRSYFATVGRLLRGMVSSLFTSDTRGI